MKNPIIGNVKTRLGNTVGDAIALDIYLELLNYTHQLALQFKGPRYLFYSDLIDYHDMWSNNSFHKLQQKGKNLGERMMNAFDQVCSLHPISIIIGVDCPYILPSHLDSAFDSLKLHQVVIGPAVDGGYYLLGTRGFYPQLFKDISWSTNKVLKQTLQRAADHNLSVAQMEILSDIDTVADWKKWLRFKSQKTAEN